MNKVKIKNKIKNNVSLRVCQTKNKDYCKFTTKTAHMVMEYSTYFKQNLQLCSRLTSGRDRTNEDAARLQILFCKISYIALCKYHDIKDGIQSICRTIHVCE